MTFSFLVGAAEPADFTVDAEELPVDASFWLMTFSFLVGAAEPVDLTSNPVAAVDLTVDAVDVTVESMP